MCGPAPALQEYRNTAFTLHHLALYYYKGLSMGKKKGDTTGSDCGSDAKAPKPATHVNVRHILCEKHSKVRRPKRSPKAGISAAMLLYRSKGPQCLNLTSEVVCMRQIMEALGRVQAGEQFSQVEGCTHADVVRTAGAGCAFAIY